MNCRQFIGGLITLLIGAGCQSARNHASAAAPGRTPARQPAYIVELIPTRQLSPTSRAGDKSNVIYSSNIVAVYLNTNGANAALTNAATAGGEVSQRPGNGK